MRFALLARLSRRGILLFLFLPPSSSRLSVFPRSPMRRSRSIASSGSDSDDDSLGRKFKVVHPEPYYREAVRPALTGSPAFSAVTGDPLSPGTPLQGCPVPAGCACGTTGASAGGDSPVVASAARFSCTPALGSAPSGAGSLSLFFGSPPFLCGPLPLRECAHYWWIGPPWLGDTSSALYLPHWHGRRLPGLLQFSSSLLRHTYQSSLLRSRFLLRSGFHPQLLRALPGVFSPLGLPPAAPRASPFFSPLGLPPAAPRALPFFSPLGLPPAAHRVPPPPH